MGVLYNIVIYPIVQIIEFVFVFTQRIFKETGLSVVAVSAAISVLCLPVYFAAEKWQRLEQDIQKRLKPKIDKIKAVFKGDERYFILSAYYRQNNYHPAYSLRSSFGLLVQIPFFIAAYTYLSHLDALKGARFLFLNDLGAPDALLGAGANILPIIMTLVNAVSGTVYSRGLPAKDRIQLYGMAALFLVLLYNSPSGLVLYWTCNNIFSLGKNILQKTKRIHTIKKAAYITFCAAVIPFAIYVLCFRDGMFLKRAVLAAFLVLCTVAPFIRRAVLRFIKNLRENARLEETAVWQTRTFILAVLTLVDLCGVVIPSSLIASSVSEFSFIENNTTPFPFIVQTFTQAVGFLLWECCLFLLFTKRVKLFLTFALTLCCAYSLVNTFLVFDNFGFLTNNLIFSDPKPFTQQYSAVLINIVSLLITLALFSFLLVSRRKEILNTVQVIMLISVGGYGIVNSIKVGTGFSRYQQQRLEEHVAAEEIEPVYHFSKNGKNVLFIMLDRGMPGFIPAIFDEKPELSSVVTGFTWYPNTVSFAGHTLIGAPPLYGSYEYAPSAINNRSGETLFEKHRQAHLLLPLLFHNSSWRTIVTDPQFDSYQASNLSIFADYPQIHAKNLIGTYTNLWMRSHPDVTGISITNLLNNNLMRFSFFKVSPLLVRNFIYDRGDWLNTAKFARVSNAIGDLTFTALNNYAHLDFLPELTRVDDNAPDTFIELYSSLTHDGSFLQAPEYVPVSEVTNKGSGAFADEPLYHVNIAAWMLLEEWFVMLKENNVYDNTRIIIVSDHGGGGGSEYEGNIRLPNGEWLQAYHTLLLVKDFNAAGDGFQIDGSFMTNADAPLLAIDGIIKKKSNPFTGSELRADKTDGISIATAGVLHSGQHGKYTYAIRKNQWLNVHGNIFDPANWEKAAK